MEELFQVHRVAKILDCTKKSVYFMIKRGELKALKFGPRQTRIPRSSIEKFIRERLNQFQAGKSLKHLSKAKVFRKRPLT